MESTRVTVTCDPPIPLASGHDSLLECGNGRSRNSRQEDGMTTYNAGSVMPGDRQSGITKDVCVADVGGAISQNGKMVHSPVMATGGASVEFSKFSAPSTGVMLPSGADIPLNNHLHFVSAEQAKSTVGLNPGQPGTGGLGSSNEALSRPRVSQDSTLTSLEDFIIKTLNRNKFDRAVMLNLEADMAAFINDSGREMWKFPPMSSYHRMLAHRVAAFFGLEHNVDDRGKSVVISRQQNTRIPDFKFRDHLSDDFIQDDKPKKSIFTRHRDYRSLEESLGVDRITLDERKCKSFEERTGDYNEAKNRIFQENPYDSKGTQVVNLETNGECGSDDPPRNLDPDGCISHSAQLQVGTSLQNAMIPMCSNAQLSTPDAVISVTPDSVTTLPFETSAIPDDEAGGDGPSTGSPFLPFPDDSGEPFAIWVASTIGQIPPGSIIINPSKGEPYTNPDGSPYRWYPPSDATEKKECSSRGPVAPDVEASAMSNEQQHEETRSPKDQSQEDLPVQASAVIASKVETATSAKSGSSVNSFPASSSSTKTQLPSTSFSGVTQPVIRADVTTRGMSVSDCHVGPAPGFIPAYGANPAPVRFACPQPVFYPSAVGVFDQQSHVVDGASYGYIPTYATDSFQDISYPPVAMPLPPTETYQPQLVQYADKTWNQYQQPMAVVPQQGATIGGQVYYGMESGLGSQGGVLSQAHPVQLILVSSGSVTDSNQPVSFTTQASVMSGGIMGSAQPVYPNFGTQPQYIPYTYRPNQPLGGAVLPFYAVSVPAPALSAPPRGPTPCLAPVTHPSAPIGDRILPNQSSSSKSFQFSVPPPPIGVPSLSRTFRPLESASGPIRVDGGRNQAWPSYRPTLNPRRPRLGLGRPPRANVAFSHANIGRDDPRCPRLPQHRMVLPPVSSNRNHKPCSTVTSVNNSSSVPLSSELRKSSVAPHPYVGATAEGMSKNPPYWKFAGFPPTCRDKM